MASSAAKSSLGQTLQFITDIKLHEVEKQRILYQTHAKAIEEANEQTDILKKVEILAKAVKSWAGSGAVTKTDSIGGKLSLQGLEFWLVHARKDPGFSIEIAEGWARTLEDHIRHTATRFDAAKLFGNLFNEWLASGDSVAAAEPNVDVDDAKSTSSAFEEVGRKEMYEQKEKLQSIIFETPVVDVKKITKYLEELFEPEEAHKSLVTLRRELRLFGRDLRRKVITNEDVKIAIKGLLTGDLMDENKRATLKAFQENPAVIDEVASVLTMRIASLDTWKWPDTGMWVEFRRSMNGKYRAFTDPEIVDALLLHHIGVAWQVKLKKALSNVFNSKAWIRTPLPSSKVKERLRVHLPNDNREASIDKEREDTIREHFFMSQLQDQASVTKSYEDLSKAVSHVSIKQKLLQIMTTECYLNTALYATHAAVCSDLAWFGPSLPHASILTVLEFLGMSKDWLHFYNAFLAAPVRFQGDPEARVRKRGTPIDYSLSVVCGEVIMFVMDFAVNQRANGLHLYRMHDDLWLWNADVGKVAAGWTAMLECAALMGLEINKEKTGSTYIGPAAEAAATLPAGDIRWGFFKFDAPSTRFRLDQSEVDTHIGEMRRQLASTKSVFGWVNLYNKYMGFFSRNFGGTPTRCFGQAHINELVDTFARIQRELFPPSALNSSGSAVGHLRRILEGRFGVTDLPEGYFYFPIATGGLGLRLTMLELLALQQNGRPMTMRVEDSVIQDKEAKISAPSGGEASDEDDNYSDDDNAVDLLGINADALLEANSVAEHKFPMRIRSDVQAYAKAKEDWEQHGDTDGMQRFSFSLLDNTFMTFQEYTALRESWLAKWGASYRDMLQTPEYVDIDLPANIEAMTDIDDSWNRLGWYESWLLGMYGDGVVKKYGGVKVVDPALIPVGMVELFRTARMKLPDQ